MSTTNCTMVQLNQSLLEANKVWVPQKTTRITERNPGNADQEVLKTAASTRLASKLVGDVAVATCVTFCVAPFLTVVDKAIVQSAAGSHTLMQSGVESLQGILRQPSNYLKSPTFLLMWGVYAATYSTANSLKTLSEHREYHNARRDSGSPQTPINNMGIGKVGVFLGTTMVNSSSSLLKDRAYAKMFGTNPTTAVVPRMAYVCWMMRDFSVIGSSFILPDLVSGHVAEAYNLDEDTARSVSQLALPIATQFVAGPLHYMGLDLFNRNLDSKTWSEALVDRSRSLYRGFSSIVTARIARIAPGYGIGGVLNTKLRDGWRNHLIDREVKAMQSPKTEEAASRFTTLIWGQRQTAL